MRACRLAKYRSDPFLTRVRKAPGVDPVKMERNREVEGY